MNILKEDRVEQKKKIKHFKRAKYLRGLIRDSGIGRLGPTGRRRVFQDIKPMGIKSIDGWRIRKSMGDIMEYVHMALDDTDHGRNLLSEKSKSQALGEERNGIVGEIARLREEHANEVKRIAREEESLRSALAEKTREVEDRSSSLESDLESMMERVRQVARTINAKHSSEGIELVCVPGIKLSYSGRLGVCGDNGRYNGKILREDDHKFILVEVNDVILGHIKIRGEDTFLSYVNAVDENGKQILKKGGIYTIKGKNSIMGEVKVEDDGKSYVCVMSGANFNYMRMSRIRRRDELIDTHLEKVRGRELVRVEVDI